MGGQRKKIKRDHMSWKQIKEERAPNEDGSFKVEAIKGKWIDLWNDEIHYKIKWWGYPKSYDSWEPMSNLGSCKQLIEDYERKRTGQKSKGLKHVNAVSTKIHDATTTSTTTAASGVQGGQQVDKDEGEDQRSTSPGHIYPENQSISLVTRDFVMARGETIPTFHGGFIINDVQHFLVKWSGMEDKLFAVENDMAVEFYSALLLKFKLDHQKEAGKFFNENLQQQQQQQPSGKNDKEEPHLLVIFENATYILPTKMIV